MIKVTSTPNTGGNSFSWFTGLINYEVVAVNPTLKELEEIGISWMKDEPKYVVQYSDDQPKISNITFWLRSVDPEIEDNSIVTPITFGIKHELTGGGASGKNQYIDIHGNTKWAMSTSDLIKDNYFSNVGSRHAYKGEADLYEFISFWLNMRSGAPERGEMLMSAEKFIAGDFSEIKDTFNKEVVPLQVKQGKPFTCRVLTGVREYTNNNGETKYTYSTYNRKFSFSSPINDKTKTAFTDYLSKEYQGFGNDTRPVEYSLDIKKFDPNSVKADSDPAPSTDDGMGLPF